MESRFGKKSLGGIALALFASLVVLGCASAPAADPLLMEKFVPALTVSEGETLVYVLRQKTYAGSALPLYVGVDDKIVADLDLSRCVAGTGHGITGLVMLAGVTVFGWLFYRRRK